MMGTNYYHEFNVCPSCGHCDREHIGKASFGRTFIFHGTPTIRSWEDWRQALQTGRIVDEYGDPVTLDAFGALVEDMRHEALNHTLYRRERDPGHEGWFDAEGHSFMPGGFS